MPYIEKEERVGLDKWLGELVPPYLYAGNLNYIVTKLLLKTKPQTYQDYNILMGVLECVKLELYRRLIAPYEDRKRDRNGEVY